MFALKNSGLFTYQGQVRCYHSGTDLFSAWPKTMHPQVKKTPFFVHKLRPIDHDLDLDDLSPLERFLMPSPERRVGYTGASLNTCVEMNSRVWDCAIDSFMSNTVRSTLVPMFVPTYQHHSKSTYFEVARPVLMIDLNTQPSFPVQYLELGTPKENLRLYAEQALHNWLYDDDMGS